MPACPRCGTQNADAAKFCSECGAPLSATIAAGGEERKLVTVVFADVAGSTGLGERLDVETLRDVMQRFFAAMRGEIEAQGGTVEKFIGDAVMAAFGVPAAHEDDPARALRAALAMRRRIARLNAEVGAEHWTELAVRIGVNTGEVIAATAPRPGEAMATGDAVNVAARLQQLAAPGEIVVGERTAAAVRGFELAPLRTPLELRGRAEAVGAFVLVGERDEPERGVPGLRAPLVGRDAELELLGSLLRRVAAERRAHLVTIYGDPGVGKSRLVAEFTGAAGARVARGRCLPYGDGITFWPLAEIAKAHAGVLDNDPPEVALAKVRALGEAAPELREAVPALVHTIGLEDPESPLRNLSPRGVIAAIHVAWRAFFAHLGADGPAIVVIEDIHWGDGALLDVLEDLTDRIPAPVLFLCPSRPELLGRRPGWGGGRRSASSVSIEPLQAADAERLVGLLLDVDGLDAGTRSRILERAEGNPFFLEEILRRLLDEGLIVRHEGRFRALAGTAEVTIPDTVQGVLAARIDLLPPDQKRAVQSAAVVGRVFWPGAVADLLNGDAGRVDELLDGLERRDLVSTRLSSSMAGERELNFRHILTRDVAYESLPRRDRPPAHARVAEWIEQAFGERRLEVSELLAHHYDLAGDRSRARVYSLEAARRDLARLALDGARAFAARAADLAETSRDRADALLVLGEAAYQAIDGDAAHDAWQEAVDLLSAGGPDDRRALARACGRMAMLATRAPGLMPNRAPAPALIRRIIDLGMEAAGDEESPTLIDLLTAEGSWGFGFPDPPPTPETIDRMTTAAERAVEIADRHDWPEQLSLALDVVLVSQELRDDVPAMAASVRRREALADRVIAIADLDDIFYMSAQVALEQGRYADAERIGREGADRVAALGGEGVGSEAMFAIARMMQGDWEPVVDRGRAIVERYGDDLPGFLRIGSAAYERVLAARGEAAAAQRLRSIGMKAATRVALRAMGLAAEGRSREALQVVQNARRVGEGRSLAMMTEAVLLGEVGRWDEALAAAASIRERAARIGWRDGPAVADRVEGRAALAAGDPARAEALAVSARDGYLAAGAAWEAAVSGLDRAEALLAMRRADEAGAELDRARPALERAGAVRELARLGALSG
jgi:class 3 adenylate cyclase/tetratricopeptide (TPR) repeat protein